MAVRTILNHIDLLPHDEQAIINTLRDDLLLGNDSVNEKQGWFIRTLSPAFVNHLNVAPKLATGFAELLKSGFSHVYVERENRGGNFCGHHPATPRFVIKNYPYRVPAEIDDLGTKRRPAILYDIVERIKKYYDDPDTIPPLQTAHFDKRTSERKRRSEFREAIVNLLSVMTMDLGSMRVGQPTKEGGFFNYSLKWLAKKANLSFSRAKRAMSALNDAMLISSYQYRELIDKEKKQYVAHNAARVFDIEFFRMLGINKQKFGKARKLAHQKQKDKEFVYQIEIREKEDAVAKLTMKKVMRSLGSRKKLKSVNLPENEDEKAKIARLHRRRTQVLIDLTADPRFHGNDEGLRAAVQQRFIELNLLTAQEKKQREAAAPANPASS